MWSQSVLVLETSDFLKTKWTISKFTCDTIFLIFLIFYQMSLIMTYAGGYVTNVLCVFYNLITSIRDENKRQIQQAMKTRCIAQWNCYLVCFTRSQESYTVSKFSDCAANTFFSEWVRREHMSIIYITMTSWWARWRLQLNHQPHDCLLNRYSSADQRKDQSFASLAFVRGIHRWPVNSPHKGPVTRKKASIWWRHYEDCQVGELLRDLHHAAGQLPW